MKHLLAIVLALSITQVSALESAKQATGGALAASAPVKAASAPAKTASAPAKAASAAKPHSKK